MEAPPHLSRAALRELDRLAVEELSLPSLVLMENAGRGAAEALLTRPWSPIAGGGETSAETVILCGAGNNAGDGYVLARHLHNAGRRVALVESVRPERLSADAAVFRRVCAAMGVECLAVEGVAAWESLLPRLRGAAIWVDALLGTGARGEPRAPLDRWIGDLNAIHTESAGSPGSIWVALDVPSGLDVDTGRAARATVRANHTLTFAAPKIGFLSPCAALYIGKVEVVGIGAPISLAWRASTAFPCQGA